MKPCAENRKLLVWLALDALDKGQARDLRSHVEACEGCRTYFEEISNVTDRLSAEEGEPTLLATQAFHRRVSAEVHTSSFAWRTLRAPVLAQELSRRLAMPAIAAACLVLVLFVVMRDPRTVRPSPTPAVRSPAAERELTPTVANYQRVANDSLEKLEAVLNQQANRRPPSAPIYTASIVTVERLED